MDEEEGERDRPRGPGVCQGNPPSPQVRSGGLEEEGVGWRGEELVRVSNREVEGGLEPREMCWEG